ncbi:hypothetical protein [Allorhizobium taibaishanense]|uniref:Uncharacterized protein n=1 Tax=Allorhizobium taibaishanense TaxID=887144 RepID=A0A1Q9A3P4_9HYPH|nr:hypothetical protein [Allorhizobium taibaishanense]OLP49224.1 hypothetical protein BJF91_19300 [Allorhizobium taibaishanense]
MKEKIGKGPTLTPILRLPDRPLSLSSDLISTPKFLFLSIPFILALGVFLVISELPDVIRDYQISQNPLALENGSVQNGRCTTHKGVFTTCEAHLSYQYQGQSYNSDVEVMFTDLHVGDYETDMVISADHPEMATISLGLDKLWNRIITLAAFALIFAGLGIGATFTGIRALLARRQLRQPAMLTPIPVEITGFNRSRGALSINYRDRIADDKTGRIALTIMRRGEEPLIIGQFKGKPVGLAVRHANAALPVLLDDRLNRLPLTDEERSVALAPFAPLLEAGQKQGLGRGRKAMAASLWKGLQVFLSVLLLFAVGAIGFWLWYVTTSDTQFQSPGMDINNAMPAPINAWGCEQLKKRFGHENAPFGCAAADFRSWK